MLRPEIREEPRAVEREEGEPVRVVEEGYLGLLGGTLVPLDEIAPKLKAIAKNGYDETIFVRGDKGVNYGTVMQVMGRINEGGFKKLSFVLDQEKGGT